MKTSGIYCIENLISGKKYIGSSINCERRFRSHKSALRRNVHRNPHLQLAWNKYEEENFSFKIILICEVKELDRYEIDLIKTYKTFDRDYGYNLDAGGTYGNRLISKETRNKLSLIKKNRGDWKGASNPCYGKPFVGKSHPWTGRHHTNYTKNQISSFFKELFKDKTKNPMYGRHHGIETKQKIRDSRKKYKGKNHPMYGKRLSKETKRKISDWHTGKTASVETKTKMSWARKGKKFSEEHKRNLSLSLKRACSRGKDHHGYGRHISEETRQKMRVGRKLAWQKQKKNKWEKQWLKYF